MKLNLGSGKKRIEGFTNVDILPWDGNTDILWDLTNVPYRFVTEPVEEIVAIEVLEHISFRDTMKVLKEWYRILKPGGRLVVQVPDCGKMMEYYTKGLICDCVPHKAERMEDFKPNPWCPKCEGKAKINPRRWLFAFTGAQKHEYDFHRNIFTEEILRENLQEAGFKKVEFHNNIYKLIAHCYK